MKFDVTYKWEKNTPGTDISVVVHVKDAEDLADAQVIAGNSVHLFCPVHTIPQCFSIVEVQEDEKFPRPARAFEKPQACCPRCNQRYSLLVTQLGKCGCPGSIGVNVTSTP